MLNCILMALIKALGNLDTVEKHDIHIKSKSYKLELLGELVI